jgi:hypothetical protein
LLSVFAGTTEVIQLSGVHKKHCWPGVVNGLRSASTVDKGVVVMFCFDPLSA